MWTPGPQNCNTTNGFMLPVGICPRRNRMIHTDVGDASPICVSFIWIFWALLGVAGAELIVHFLWVLRFLNSFNALACESKGLQESPQCAGISLEYDGRNCVSLLLTNTCRSGNEKSGWRTQAQQHHLSPHKDGHDEARGWFAGDTGGGPPAAHASQLLR